MINLNLAHVKVLQVVLHLLSHFLPDEARNQTLHLIDFGVLIGHLLIHLSDIFNHLLMRDTYTLHHKVIQLFQLKETVIKVEIYFLHVFIIRLYDLAKVINEELVGLVPEFSLMPHIYLLLLRLPFLSSLCVFFKLLRTYLRVKCGLFCFSNKLLHLLDLDFSYLFRRSDFDLFFHYYNN